MWLLVFGLAFSLRWTGAAPPIHPRMVFGWDCPPLEHPWQAAVFPSHHLMCSGVLIHPHSSSYSVCLGCNDIHVHAEKDAQWMEVARAIRHPKYCHPFECWPLNYSHDIMLLHLKEPVKITHRVKTIGLPTRGPRMGSLLLNVYYKPVSHLSENVQEREMSPDSQDTFADTSVYPSEEISWC
ncbi:PREDICTED: kallikrein-1E2-like [Elephantulus edwardii]|uniref:kallikrein-1E2-like n=1 Tax=Elephantulus edwardii TaxID=28737 RepID=UPI0003F07792|nr:PREDICTED: kallikrein-1E2-like [Elephantulus edwardii]